MDEEELIKSDLLLSTPTPSTTHDVSNAHSIDASSEFVGSGIDGG